MELQIFSLLVLQEIIVNVWILIQIHLQIWSRFLLALHERSLELLGHRLAQRFLHLFPFIDFTWIVSLDEPRIVLMLCVELLFLLLLVLNAILGICVIEFLSIKCTRPSVLVALEVFSRCHCFVV